jgi:hypothetical protein
VGCGGGPIGGLISIEGSFGRCTPMEILTCWLKMLPSEGRSLDTWRMGSWSHLPLLSNISLFVIPPKDSGSEGVSSTRTPTAARTALQAYLLCLCGPSRSLPISFASMATTVHCRHGWLPTSPLLVVIKCIYLLPTYLYFIQDIEDRCLLLMSSTSFVDLPFQEHEMMDNHHMDQNSYIYSL